MNYRTLHEGGTGLGQDVHEADTVELDALTLAQMEIKRLKMYLNSALLANERMLSRCHWLLLSLPVAFGLGIVFALKVLA